MESCIDKNKILIIATTIVLFPLWIILVFIGAVILSILVSIRSVRAWVESCIEEGLITSTKNLIEQMTASEDE